jgi:hypothetical protein
MINFAIIPITIRHYAMILPVRELLDGPLLFFAREA